MNKEEVKKELEIFKNSIEKNLNKNQYFQYFLKVDKIDEKTLIDEYENIDKKRKRFKELQENFIFDENSENPINLELKNLFEKVEYELEIYIKLLEERENKRIMKEMRELLKEKENYEKKILEIMGIFLSIFSVIGLGVSGVLNVQNNHFSTWSMICGVILITMSGLFYLINFNEKFEKKNLKIIVPIIAGIILLGLGGIIRYVVPDENKELIKREEFEMIEKKFENKKKELLDYYSRINELKETVKKLEEKEKTQKEKLEELKIQIQNIENSISKK